MSYSDVLLFDPGASQWRCGRAEEEGPDVILPGVPDGDHEAWQRQVRAGIEALLIGVRAQERPPYPACRAAARAAHTTTLVHAHAHPK